MNSRLWIWGFSPRPLGLGKEDKIDKMPACGLPQCHVQFQPNASGWDRKVQFGLVKQKCSEQQLLTLGRKIIRTGKGSEMFHSKCWTRSECKENNAFYSFLLLLFIQQPLPGYVLHARPVFGAVDTVNKLGRPSASWARSGSAVMAKAVRGSCFCLRV